MSRCDVHCPTASGFPWLAVLMTAASALALWGISHLAHAIGRPVLTALAAAGVLAVGGMVWLFVVDAVTSVPQHERRPRISELPAPVAEPVAVVEPVTYPPLRAVPDLEERAA